MEQLSCAARRMRSARAPTLGCRNSRRTRWVFRSTESDSSLATRNFPKRPITAGLVSPPAGGPRGGGGGAAFKKKKLVMLGNRPKTQTTRANFFHRGGRNERKPGPLL